MKRLLFTQKKRKRQQKCCCYCEKLYHNWVAFRKTRMRWFLKEENSPGGNPMQKVLEPIQRVRFTKSTLRHASIREQKGSSLGQINVKVPHKRSPHAMEFEDESQEETERQQRCARSKAWNLCQKTHAISKRTTKLLSTFHKEEWVLPAASTKEPEEKEFVVDSVASMHMVSKRDLNYAELETMRISRSPMTVMTANGEVQTREKATVYVVTVMPLEETFAVLFLGKLYEDHGYTYHWTSGQKTHLTK